MLSLPDMAILGVLALLVFGEQKLPGIMRQAGRVMREVQNTSQSFIREMERAADVNEPSRPSARYTPAETPAYEAEPPAAEPYADPALESLNETIPSEEIPEPPSSEGAFTEGAPTEPPSADTLSTETVPHNPDEKAGS